jgi:hypothetical protein
MTIKYQALEKVEPSVETAGSGFRMLPEYKPTFPKERNNVTLERMDMYVLTIGQESYLPKLHASPYEILKFLGGCRRHFY